MPKFQDLTGQRFSRLLITGLDTSKDWSRTRWAYLCDCGKTGAADPSHLNAGRTQSCGCLKREPNLRNKTHGERSVDSSGKMSGTYRSWAAMWQRCTNPKNDRWERYGGRGIKIDPRWSSFEVFLGDMGPRPEGLTIERENTDEDYGPGNCVWATNLEQANNRSGQRKYLVDDQLLTQAALSRYWGIPRHQAKKRTDTMTPHIKDPT